MTITLFITCLILSAVECGPATPSYGTIAAEDFSKNLGMVNLNLYTGFTGLTTPLSKLAIDTAPNLAQLYAMFNGYNIPPPVAALLKDLYRQTAVGGGKLAGSAAVSGSSVLASLMNLGGHGLQAGGQVAEAAGSSTISLAGKLGDYVASGTTVGTDILASGLKTAGDSKLTGSVAANVISQGISGLLDAIGGRLAAAITSAEQTVVQLMNSNVKVLENGALQFADKTNERVYKGLVAYVQILTHVQNLFNQLVSIINSIANLNVSLTPTASASASSAASIDPKS